MDCFSKICAAFAFVLGVVLLLLGGIGLITGCKANFSLPPVLGVIPAIFGWGIVRSVYVAWNANGRPRESVSSRFSCPSCGEDQHLTQTADTEYRCLRCNTVFPSVAELPGNIGGIN